MKSKAFEPAEARDLKFSGMVHLNGNLCLTTFGGGGQQIKGQIMKFFKCQ